MALEPPKVVMPVSQRRAEIESCRFVDVRNLVHLVYKKGGPNGTEPLMTYQETLNDRELVKQTLLNYEIAQGWLIPDGTEGQPVAAQTTTNVAPQGVPVTQFQPQQPQQFASPQQQAPVPQPFVPQGQPMPQQMQAMPQQPGMMPAPQPMPVATPQQAAQAGAPAEAPGGRKRRAPGTAPAGGAAVAPPVAPPPQTMPQPAAFQQPQQFQQTAPAPFAPAPQQFQQAAPQQFAAPVAPMQQAPAPQAQVAPAAVDLSPIVARLDALGATLNGQVDLGTSIKAELAETRKLLMLILVATHHQYLTNPQLAPNTQGQANDLPGFQTFLSQYLPK